MNTAHNTSAVLGSTLQIGRRSFVVSEVIETGDLNRPRYILSGPRGARYSTMRNVHNQDVMFLVHDGGRGFGLVTAFAGVQLRDGQGGLEVRA